MRDLPVPDPGTPDCRSATRYLWWIARMQRSTVIFGIVCGVVWMLAQALIPYATGMAIGGGIAGDDTSALLRWSGALLGLGLIQATAGMLRHRCAVINWLSAAYRTVQVTVRHAGHLGATLPKRLAAGEVVSIGTSDISHIGNAIDVTARGSGAVVAVIVVAVILLQTSVRLGLVVIIGVPVLMASWPA